MKFFELHEKNRLICANWYIIAIFISIKIKFSIPLYLFMQLGKIIYHFYLSLQFCSNPSYDF